MHVMPQNWLGKRRWGATSMSSEIDVDGLSGSYSVIDYRIRPAKHAERAMLVEAAARLRFAGIQSYRYIGFGAIYFTDFKLFHRTLGITDLHNIEGREVDRARFNWNRPFTSIKMHFGMSSEVLPKLKWRKRSIVWLDYDGQLNLSKLKDIDYLIRNLASGSMLLISINAEKPSPPGLSREAREADLVEALRLLVGPERVKSAVSEKDLRGKFAAGVYYQIIRDFIQASLSIRNALIADPDEKLEWEQVVHAVYRDGARMLTLGGVLFRRAERGLFESGQFDKLSFYRSSDNPYEIEIPLLTMKEMTSLDRAALSDPAKAKVLPFLKPKERTNYIRMMRYLPSYVSADM